MHLRTFWVAEKHYPFVSVTQSDPPLMTCSASSTVVAVATLNAWSLKAIIPIYFIESWHLKRILN